MRRSEPIKADSKRDKSLQRKKFDLLIHNPEQGFEAITTLRAAVEQVVEVDGKSERRFNTALFNEVQVETKKQAIERAFQVCADTFKIMHEKFNVRFDMIEPGHGLGHLVRDYLNALRLADGFAEDEIDPKQLFIGLVGGMMHDIGVATVPRFREEQTPVGHAEAGALLLGQTLQGVSDTEKKLIQYAVSASTHYLRDKTYGDMKKQTYLDTYNDETGAEQPIHAVWISRWIDRLDCSGPAWGIGRHPLTTLEPHKDYGGNEDGHFTVDFEEHFKPLFRSAGDRKNPPQTMLEHLELFRSSQVADNPPSPYNRFDSPSMVALRNPQAERLGKIIADVRQPKEFTPQQGEVILQAWKVWLGRCAEPGQAGQQRAQQLIDRFRTLEPASQTAWLTGIEEGLKQYEDWSTDMQSFLAQQPPEKLKFFGLLGDQGIASIVVPPKEVLDLAR